MKRVYLTLTFTFLNFILLAQNTILIKNVNVWNGKDANVKKNYDVLVVDNLIQQVDQNINTAEDAIIINGKGENFNPWTF